jgi:DNA-binding MarR family transcriptional regulator
MKRAYWGSRTFQARIAKRYGLTPSRFEMLLAIAQQPSRSVPQSWLPEILGCTRQVVSRMVRALEALGLVERDHYRPVAPTGLTSPVYITDEGLGRIQALAAEMIETGSVELAVQSVACEEWTSKESQERDPALLTEGLRRVRKNFGDEGELDCNQGISNEKFPRWEVLGPADPQEPARRRQRYLTARRKKRRLRRAFDRERARYAQHAGMRPLHDLYRHLADDGES